MEDASSGINDFEYVVANILCGYFAYLYYMGYRIDFELYAIDYDDHYHRTWSQDNLSHIRDAHGGAIAKSPRYTLHQRGQPLDSDDLLYNIQSRRDRRNERSNDLQVEPRRLQYNQSRHVTKELNVRDRVHLLSGRPPVTPAKAVSGLGSIATQLIRSTPTADISQGW